MIELEQTNGQRSPVTPRANKFKTFLIVLAMAVALYAVLYLVLNFLLDQWSAQELERTISQSLHRDVQLGRVKWNMGFDGLVFHTDSIDVKDPDGTPFLSAGKTDISVAVLPLLSKEVQVRHVDLTKPVVWAKKLNWADWNAADLSKDAAFKYINHLGVHDGTLHLADATKGAVSGADAASKNKLTNVSRQPAKRTVNKAGQTQALAEAPANDTLVEKLDGSVERPFGNFAWNYHLSFQVPHPQYATKFALKGTGNGTLDEWSTNHIRFNLQASNLNPYDFVTVAQPFSYCQGPVTLELDGAGIPAKGLSAKAYVKTPQFEFTSDKLTFAGANTQNSSAAAGDAARSASQSQTTTDKANQSQANSVSTSKPPLSGIVTMSGARMKMPNVALVPSSVDGQLSFVGDRVFFNNLAGKIGNGGFKLNGTAEPGKSIDISCSSTLMDLKAVRQTLHALKISPPAIFDHPFFGIVRDSTVAIKGGWNKPDVVVTASPQDVYYQAPGQHDQLFQASQGQLQISESAVVLHSVNGRVGSGTYQLNGKIGLNPHAPIDLTFKGEHVDVATVKQTLQALGVDTKAIDPAVGGKVEGAVGSVRGTVGNVVVSMAVVPNEIIYQPPGTQRVIELVGGRVDVIGANLHFYHTKGRLADGTFTLDGLSGMLASGRDDLKFEGRNLDLSHVKVALQELQVKSPLLAEQLLYGKVKTVSLTIKGAVANPAIAMLCFPDDVRYEPVGSDRPMHLRGGRVTYKGDTLAARDIHVTTARSRFVTSLIIDHLSTSSNVRSLTADASSFDATDLHSYLQAPRTPPPLRDQYLAVLDQLQIVPQSGKLHGHIDWLAHDNTFNLACNVNFDRIGATAFGIPVEQVAGHIETSGDQLNVNNLTGNISHSPFSAAGSISHFTDQQAQSWSLTLSTDVHLNNLLKTISDKYKPQGQIHSPKPIALSVHLTGSSGELLADFTAKVDPQAAFVIRGPYGGEFQKPIGQPLTLDGSLMITPTLVTINQAQAKFADTEVDLKGTCERTKNAKDVPAIDFRLSIPKLIPIRDFLTFIQFNHRPLGTEDVTGTFRGHLHLKGAADRPSSHGFLLFNDVSMPMFKISHLTGQADRADVTGTSGGAPIKLNIQQVVLEKVKLMSVQGDVLPCSTPGCDGAEIKNLTASYGPGKVMLDGTVSPSAPAHLNVQAKGINSNTLITDLFGMPGEMTGTMDGAAQIDADLNATDLLTSLSGHGTAQVTDGKVARFSALERGISAENVLHSGIFDFNLNNLISTVAPFQSGKFTKISANFNMSKGKLSINNVFYQSKELRLRAKGVVDLAKNSMQMNVAGAVPRVSTRGILGPVARFLSIHGLTDWIEDLPERLSNHYVPNNGPRAFAFKISAPADKPKSIADSIMKSFHWLKARPASTPHPAVLEDQAEPGAPAVATATVQLHNTSTSDGISAQTAAKKSKRLPVAPDPGSATPAAGDPTARKDATTAAKIPTPAANQATAASQSPTPEGKDAAVVPKETTTEPKDSPSSNIASPVAPDAGGTITPGQNSTK